MKGRHSGMKSDVSVNAVANRMLKEIEIINGLYSKGPALRASQGQAKVMALDVFHNALILLYENLARSTTIQMHKNLCFVEEFLPFPLLRLCNCYDGFSLRQDWFD